MAYLSKKNVKWNSEPVLMLKSSAAEYTQVQETVIKSAPHSKTLVSSCPSITVASTETSAQAEYAALPSLAPLPSQEVEVDMLNNIPQQASVDINAMYGQREQDRKVRREIANSNERRRMQSINAGFKALKTILPQTAGEKLSKAAILQQTAEYILQLDSDKTKLLTLHEKYRSALAECKCDNAKRRALLSEGLDKDEGIGSPREEEFEDFRRDSVEIRLKLDQEKRIRMELEEKVRELEARPHPDSCMMDSRPHLVIKRRSTSDATLPRMVPVPTRVKTELTPTYPDDKVSPIPVLDLPHQVDPNHAPSPHIITSSEVPYSFATQDTKPTGTLHTKHTATLPRSRQPLKKRAVELVDNESPKTKMSRVQINSSVLHSMLDASSPKPVVIPPPTAPKATVLVHQAGNPPVVAVADPSQANMPVTMQTVAGGRTPQEKLVPTAGILNIRPQLSLAEQQSLLLSATSAAAPTYITLSPASAVLPGAPVTWPESQVALAAPNYSFAITPSNPSAPQAQSQYVIQPTIPRIPTAHPEEMTLNQLNTVPSLSMTLTQLNAVPTVARLNSGLPPGGAALPSTRLQTHYLPVVAMDTVLSHQSERRMSSHTTDSSPSDEDSKSLDDQNLLRATRNLVSASSRRTKSDPGIPMQELHPKEVVVCNPTAPVLTHATLTTVTNGPGSPLYRQIDAAATRRNLETIVQAIDHLEQQERRNSQDQQTTNR